jgi:aspartyl/asparaginyl-tRNA synthetase
VHKNAAETHTTGEPPPAPRLASARQGALICLNSSMAWVYIDELGRHAGEEVTLKGWLYNRRSSGKIHFLLLRDGTGVCQCVALLNEVGADAFAAADHLGQETSLEVTGVVREDKRAPGGFSLRVSFRPRRNSVAPDVAL